ncbi:unnamed protein product [marine sediment metagenome]|uniref:Aldehyde dehydrogenase domain-containing protein n=1 Tax=marine sediment metagenome TaxID=412755 RepID=X1JJ03_9ZZZZ
MQEAPEDGGVDGVINVGIAESGWGRLGGRAALEEFTELRWITMQRTPRQYPF